ncbi:MAG: hypothetical protein WD009_13335 [Phycisphaeraceae bacterium]
MSSRTLAALILINAVLVAALSITAVRPPAAHAQAGGDGGGGGAGVGVGGGGNTRYVMLAGEVARGGPPAAIYIVNTQTSDIIVARYDARTDNLVFQNRRNINADVERARQGQP